MSAEEHLDDQEAEAAEQPPREPYLPSEVVTALSEDPEFPEVLGRVRAAARGEEYDPAKHHPQRRARRQLRDADPETEERLAAVIDRFKARGASAQRRLDSVSYLRAL